MSSNVSVTLFQPAQQFVLYSNSAGWGPNTPAALAVAANANNPQEIYTIPLMAYKQVDGQPKSYDYDMNQNANKYPHRLNTFA